MIVSVVIYLQLTLVPIHSGFCLIVDGHLVEGPENRLDTIILVLDLVLCSDVVINLFTGYYSEPKKEVVLDMKYIFL